MRHLFEQIEKFTTVIFCSDETVKRLPRTKFGIPFFRLEERRRMTNLEFFLRKKNVHIDGPLYIFKKRNR